MYLKMTKCQTSGDTVDAMRKQLIEKAGEAAAKMVYAAVTFEVTAVRPLADFGQGWEKSYLNIFPGFRMLLGSKRVFIDFMALMTWGESSMPR